MQLLFQEIEPLISIKDNQKVRAALLNDNLLEKWQTFLELAQNKLVPRLRPLFPNNDERATKIEKDYIKASILCEFINALRSPFKDFLYAFNTITRYVNETYKLNLPLIAESYKVTVSEGDVVSFCISKIGLFKNEPSSPLLPNRTSAAQLLGNTGSLESTDSGKEMKTMTLSS